MDLTTNANTHWASIFVEELVRCGLQAVCLAPGSRSTPLVLACAVHPSVHVYRHLDERSAAFFALGLAMATERPIALVCTSGTAAANFHPAIIEAYYSYVPLLVLTADRPPELRQSGANQTIDQIKMFGDHVRWSVELPVPQADAPELVLRHLRTLAARAYATANGLTRGPVHLNFPFRQPLQPSASAGGYPGPVSGGRANGLSGDPAGGYLSGGAFTRIDRGHLVPDSRQVADAAEIIGAHSRGLIICGPCRPDEPFKPAVSRLAQATGYPVLADGLSNLRHGAHVKNGLVLGAYPFWLPALGQRVPKPDVLLRFGSVPTSAALAAYLNAASPAVHLHIREGGEWADDLHLTHDLLQVDPAAFCNALADALEDGNLPRQSSWPDYFRDVEARTWLALNAELRQGAFYDGQAAHLVLSSLPEGVTFLAGNSLPVRHLDQLDRPSTTSRAVYGNRGASGIDGNVSTALGLAAAAGHQPLVALLGDITFYHDMNGLLAVRQHGLDNAIFVVINNNGGGIFRRLPIAQHEPPFTELFVTPHGLSFEHAAAMYGLRYCAVEGANSLETALTSIFTGRLSGPHLVEIKTDGPSDYERHVAVTTAVATAISTALYAE